MSNIIKTTKKPETYRDPKELIGELSNGWSKLYEKDRYWHIVPDMDTRLHILQEDKCWCEPIECVDLTMVHNAHDGRDLYNYEFRKLN